MSTSRTTRARSRARAGFTFLEIVVVLLLVGVLVAVGFGAMTESVGSVGIHTAVDQMRLDSNLALNRIANHLSNTERSRLTTEVDAVSFQENQGWNAGTNSIDWSPVLYRYGLEGSQVVFREGGVRMGVVANDVKSFAVTPAPEAPLTSLNRVTVELVLERQIGLKPDTTPHLVEVRATRTIFVRGS